LGAFLYSLEFSPSAYCILREYAQTGQKTEKALLIDDKQDIEKELTVDSQTSCYETVIERLSK